MTTDYRRRYRAAWRSQHDGDTRPHLGRAFPEPPAAPSNHRRRSCSRLPATARRSPPGLGDSRRRRGWADKSRSKPARRRDRAAAAGFALDRLVAAVPGRSASAPEVVRHRRTLVTTTRHTARLAPTPPLRPPRWLSHSSPAPASTAARRSQNLTPAAYGREGARELRGSSWSCVHLPRSVRRFRADDPGSGIEEQMRHRTRFRLGSTTARRGA